MPTAETQRAFKACFGTPPEVIVRAPGRVNLMGDHTDYNDGLVLPMAIDRAMDLALSRSDQPDVEAHSIHFDETVVIATDDRPPRPLSPWSRYVHGVVTMLNRRGIETSGTQIWIGGDLPPGAGLASSAALEVGVAEGLLTLAGRTLSRSELATLCQTAEHEFADSPCGIMDQLCCTSAKLDHALLIDCQTLKTDQVPLRLGSACFVVMDSGVRHAIAGPEYAQRQRECTQVIDTLRAADPSISSFRDVTTQRLASLPRELDGLPFRRLRHVVTENDRVVQSADALRIGDLPRLGRLMSESHASLRDDYEVSCREIDELVTVARSLDGVYGARLTGGGFGGCAIALVEAEAVVNLSDKVRELASDGEQVPAHAFAVQSAHGVFACRPNT